jgi:hypothetical protein
MPELAHDDEFGHELDREPPNFQQELLAKQVERLNHANCGCRIARHAATRVIIAISICVGTVIAHLVVSPFLPSRKLLKTSTKMLDAVHNRLPPAD